MSKFSEIGIEKTFEDSRKRAAEALKGLKVCCAKTPDFAALNGWVFEQTIQYCIRKEFKAKGLKLDELTEQFKLDGRIRADLKLGNIAIEIKLAGLWAYDDVAKYKKYQNMAAKRGLHYLFLSMYETNMTSRRGIVRALGKPNVFFLFSENDKCCKGEWDRFIRRLINLLRK